MCKITNVPTFFRPIFHDILMNFSFLFSERELPSRSGGLIYAFQNVMDKTEAEAWDVKRFEKMFKKQLNELEIDNEMLQIKLKNKIKEMNQLRMQYRDKEVSEIRT